MVSHHEESIQSIGRSYALLRRMHTRALFANTPHDADAEFRRIDTLAQAAGHVAVAGCRKQDEEAGMAELNRLLAELSPEYRDMAPTSLYSRNPFTKASELIVQTRLVSDLVKDGLPFPLSPRFDAQMFSVAALRQYLSHRRRLYAPISDNIDAYARTELIAAGIGQRFNGDFEVVSMAIDPATKRTAMRSDVQVLERDPMIFLDQVVSGQTLAVVIAGLEARAGRAINPMIL